MSPESINIKRWEDLLLFIALSLEIVRIEDWDNKQASCSSLQVLM